MSTMNINNLYVTKLLGRDVTIGADVGFTLDNGQTIPNSFRYITDIYMTSVSNNVSNIGFAIFWIPMEPQGYYPFLSMAVNDGNNIIPLEEYYKNTGITNGITEVDPNNQQIMEVLGTVYQYNKNYTDVGVQSIILDSPAEQQRQQQLAEQQRQQQLAEQQRQQQLAEQQRQQQLAEQQRQQQLAEQQRQQQTIESEVPNAVTFGGGIVANHGSSYISQETDEAPLASENLTTIETGKTDDLIEDLFPYTFKSLNSSVSNTDESKELSACNMILFEYAIKQIFNKYNISDIGKRQDVKEVLQLKDTIIFDALDLLTRKCANISKSKVNYIVEGSNSKDGEFIIEVDDSILPDRDGSISISPDTAEHKVFEILRERLMCNAGDKTTITQWFNMIHMLSIQSESSCKYAMFIDILNLDFKVKSTGSEICTVGDKIPYLNLVTILLNYINNISLLYNISYITSKGINFKDQETRKTLLNSNLLSSIEGLTEAMTEYNLSVEQDSVKNGYITSLIGPTMEQVIVISKDADSDSDSDQDDDSDSVQSDVSDYLKYNGALVDFIFNNVLYPYARKRGISLIEAELEISALSKSPISDCVDPLYNKRISEILGFNNFMIKFTDNSLDINCSIGKNKDNIHLDKDVLAMLMFKYAKSFTATNRPITEDIEASGLVTEYPPDDGCLNAELNEMSGDSSDQIGKVYNGWKYMLDCQINGIDVDEDCIVNYIPIANTMLYHSFNSLVNFRKAQMDGDTFFAYLTQPAFLGQIMYSEKFFDCVDREKPLGREKFFSLTEVEKLYNKLDENDETEKQYRTLLEMLYGDSAYNVDTDHIPAFIDKCVKGASARFSGGYTVKYKDGDIFVDGVTYNSCAEEAKKLATTCEEIYEATSGGMRDLNLPDLTSTHVYYYLCDKISKIKEGKSPFDGIEQLNLCVDYEMIKPVFVRKPLQTANGKLTSEYRLIGAVCRPKTDGKNVFIPFAGDNSVEKGYMDYIVDNGINIGFYDYFSKICEKLSTGKVVPDPNKWSDPAFETYRKICNSALNNGSPVAPQILYKTFILKIFSSDCSIETARFLNETLKDRQDAHRIISQQKAVINFKSICNKSAFKRNGVEVEADNILGMLDSNATPETGGKLYEVTTSGSRVLQSYVGKILYTAMVYMYAWSGDSMYSPFVLDLNKTESSSDMKIVDYITTEFAKSGYKGVNYAPTSMKSLLKYAQIMDDFSTDNSVTFKDVEIPSWVNKFETEINNAYNSILGTNIYNN